MSTLHGALVAILAGPEAPALIAETLRAEGEPLCVADAELIERILCNRVDAVVFAAPEQAERLLRLAATKGLHGPVVDALNHEAIVAAADERCAQLLWERGIQPRVVAAEPHGMPVVAALAAFITSEIARGRRPDPAVLAGSV